MNNQVKDYHTVPLAGLAACTKTLQMVFKQPKTAHVTHFSLHWLTAAARIKFKSLVLAYRVATTTAPTYLNSLVQVYEPLHSLWTANERHLVLPTALLCTSEADNLFSMKPQNVQKRHIINNYMNELCKIYKWTNNLWNYSKSAHEMSFHHSHNDWSFLFHYRYFISKCPFKSFMPFFPNNPFHVRVSLYDSAVVTALSPFSQSRTPASLKLNSCYQIDPLAPVSWSNNNQPARSCCCKYTQTLTQLIKPAHATKLAKLLHELSLSISVRPRLKRHC